MPCDLRLTSDQFALLGAENFEVVLELAADGSLIVITSRGSETCARISRLEMRLLLWADQQGGWKVFGTSSKLPPAHESVVIPSSFSERTLHFRVSACTSKKSGTAEPALPICPKTSYTHNGSKESQHPVQ